MSKPSKADKRVEEVRAQKRILGGITTSVANLAVIELLVEIRDLLRKASGK